MEELPFGTIVRSPYHGTGKVTGHYGGCYQIRFEPAKKGKKKIHSGGEFNYAHDGRYFTSGEFRDKKPVLVIVSKPKEEERT